MAMLPASETSLLLSSQAADWQGVHLEYHHKPKGEENSFALKQWHLLCIETTQRSCDARKWMDRQFQQRPIIHGDVFLLPEQVLFRERFEGAIDYILLYLKADWVASVAQDILDPARVEILPHFPQPDPFIYQTGLLLKSAIEAKGRFNQLYGETLALALATHLLQHYAGEKTSQKLLQPVVQPASKLNETIEYMQSHCDQNLSLSELANQAQMSLHYFARCFKQAVGVSPHQYLIRCRIEQAKVLLRQNELSIGEIAQRAGFTDQSHLSRHFRQQAGCTPRQWRSEWR